MINLLRNPEKSFTTFASIVGNDKIYFQLNFCYSSFTNKIFHPFLCKKTDLNEMIKIVAQVAPGII